MKRFLSPVLYLSFLFLLAPIQGQTRQDPDRNQNSPGLLEEEIRTDPVNFENRSLLRASRQRREMDINLGALLAEEVLKNGSVERNGFRITRLFEKGTPGHGADVVEILPDANFGHVNVIQRVLSGYLAEAFQYGKGDAGVLARFLLYYNASVRPRWKEVSGKYSGDVGDFLSSRYPGISTVYRDWPGKTAIVLPLKKSLVRPGQTDLDHGEVNRETHDASSSDRQELKEVQQRRREDDLNKLEEKKSEIKQEKKELNQEKKDLKQEEKEIQQEKKQNEEKLTELKKNPEANREEIKKEEKRKEELTRQEEQNQTEQTENQKRTDEVANQEKQVEEQIQKTENADASEGGDSQKSPVGKSEMSQDQVAALVEENKQLKEEKKKEEQMSENVVGEKILFLKILRYIEGGHYNNELWQIDPVKDDALSRGPFTNICGKEFLPVEGKGVVVIGYDDGEHTNDRHHLVLLDSSTLALSAMTKEEIFWRSPMIEKDGMIYAVEVIGNEYYLSRFKMDMTLDQSSSVPINPNSNVTFFKEKIYVTGQQEGTQGKTGIQVFNRSDLKLIKSINP